jgi:hypothetical protein
MRVTILFILAMIVAALYALSLDLRFGMAYLGAIIPLVIIQYAFCGDIRRIDQVILSISILSIWAFYFLRPLFLFSNPELFKFISLYRINTQLHVDTLNWLAIANLAFLIPLMLILRLACPYPRESLFRHNELQWKMQSLFVLLLGTGGLYTVVSALAVVSPSVGGRILSFCELLLPVEFIAPFSLAILISLPGVISPKMRIGLYLLLSTYVASQLLQGSKSFLLEIVYMSIVITLIRFGDFTIPFRRLSFYLGGTVVLFFSFPLAMAVRRISDDVGFGGISIVALIERIKFMGTNGTSSHVLSFGTDLITKRLNGYDGSLAVIQIIPGTFPETFNLNVLFANGLASTIPGLQSEFEAFGAAVSKKFYPFLNATGTNSHGGAVGGYAMLSLITKGDYMLSALAVAIYGVIWGWLMAITTRLQTIIPLRYVTFGGLIMAYSLSTNGGNFDRIFRSLFVLYLHFGILVFYAKINFSVRPAQ